jgi:hypothetical protein
VFPAIGAGVTVLAPDLAPFISSSRPAYTPRVSDYQQVTVIAANGRTIAITAIEDHPDMDGTQRSTSA